MLIETYFLVQTRMNPVFIPLHPLTAFEDGQSMDGVAWYKAANQKK